MKKLISAVISFIMLFSVSAFAEDVKISDWAEESVRRAHSLNIAEEGREYDYTAAITREEFCELVFNTIIAVQGSVTTEEKPNVFTDTDNSKVIALNRLGIIRGKTDTEFFPNDALTREEAASIIVRMINAVMPMAVHEVYFMYDDMDQVSDWAADSVQIISNMGFMTGVGGNKFAPKDNYTVEQSMSSLVRIYDSAKKKFEYTTPLGKIVTDKNGDSHINFAVETQATVALTKDASDINGTTVTLKTPVTAFTNQTTTEYISFDSFADIFGGEWKLNENRFEFTYDDSVKPETDKYTRETAGMDEWPNKTESVPVVFFSSIDTITVNGKEIDIVGMYGGDAFKTNILMHNGTLYIPVQTVAELLDYDLAYLEISA